MHAPPAYGLQVELAKAALTELADAVAAEVQPSLRWLAELDVTAALAEVAEQHGLTKPEVVSESVLEIEKGARGIRACDVSVTRGSSCARWLETSFCRACAGSMATVI